MKLTHIQNQRLTDFASLAGKCANLVKHVKLVAALPGDKTVLMIAHRLSTVKRCDRIIVLDKGQLVGCDTWDTLMANNAAFRKIASVDPSS